MEIKDQSGNVIGIVELKEGYDIKDIIEIVSKKSTSSFKNIVSVYESNNKKQLVFKFSNGEIFYDLPSKTFVRSNGVKISEQAFRYIKPNLDNNKTTLRSGRIVDDFWLMLTEKTNVTWIKTFFKFIHIEANVKYYDGWVKQEILDRNNKLSRLIKDKKLFDNLETFAKIPAVSNLDEDKLLKFYKGVNGEGHCSNQSISKEKISLDKWLIQNISEDISSSYVEEEILGQYISDYIACQKNGLKELFQYTFDKYRAVILSKYIEKLKKLISLGYEQKRLIEYLYRDIYNQGLELDFSCHHYYMDSSGIALLHDYASMNVDMNCEYEKYPRYLSTAHNITQKNYQIKEDGIIEEKFKKVVKNLKNKKLVYSDDDYVVVLPKNSKDLTKEGQNLNHCVASYYKRMALGETNIVFLRNKKIVNESLVTIELNSMYEIVQAKGKNNSSPKEPERKFIDKYRKYLASLAKV